MRGNTSRSFTDKTAAHIPGMWRGCCFPVACVPILALLITIPGRGSHPAVGRYCRQADTLAPAVRLSQDARLFAQLLPRPAGESGTVISSISAGLIKRFHAETDFLKKQKLIERIGTQNHPDAHEFIVTMLERYDTHAAEPKLRPVILSQCFFLPKEYFLRVEAALLKMLRSGFAQQEFDFIKKLLVRQGKRERIRAELKRDIEGMQWTMKADERTAVRCRLLIEVLEKQREDGAISLLKKAMRARNDDIHRSAALALFSLGEVHYLLNQVERGDFIPTKAAAFALTRNGCPFVGALLQRRMGKEPGGAQRINLAHLMCALPEPRAQFYGYRFFMHYYLNRHSKFSRLYFRHILLLRQELKQALRAGAADTAQSYIDDLLNEMKRALAITPLENITKINLDETALQSYLIIWDMPFSARSFLEQLVNHGEFWQSRYQHPRQAGETAMLPRQGNLSQESFAHKFIVTSI